MVKSRRGSLKSSSSLSPSLQQQQQQQPHSGSLVSAVLDSASSASPRIFPLDPGASSVELFERSRNTNNNLLNNRHSATSAAAQHGHKNGSAIRAAHADKRNELSKRIIPTAPPYPPLVHGAPLATLGSRTRGSSISAAATVPSEKEREAQIVPEPNGIGRRLLNGFYDEFLDGLPFRRQSASTYCDPPPARRYSLMGRAGTARNSEFKRNPITQHRQR